MPKFEVTARVLYGFVIVLNILSVLKNNVIGTYCASYTQPELTHLIHFHVMIYVIW